MKNTAQPISLTREFRRNYLLIPIIPLALLFLLIVNSSWITWNSTEKKITHSLTDIRDEAQELLTRFGETVIANKAEAVAKQIELYFMMYPETPVQKMREDPVFMSIALQKVGETGYTVLTEAETQTYRVHANPELNDTDMNAQTRQIPALESLVKGGTRGSPYSQYYEWPDPDGIIRQKYMEARPVGIKHLGLTYIVTATTYIDEFTQPLVQMSESTEQVLSEFSTYITRQWIIISLTGSAVTAVTLLLILLMGRQLNKKYIGPIVHLSETAKKLGEGYLDSPVRQDILGREDEIGVLGEELSLMAGQIRGFISNLERRLSELSVTKHALEASEQYHKLIAEFSSDYIYSVTFPPTGRPEINFLSGSHTEITGYTPQEINSFREGWLHIVHPEDVEIFGLPPEEKINSEAGQEYLYRIIRKDGEIRWLVDRMKPICDEKGRIVSILGAARDITPRKRVEEQLEESLREKEVLLKELYHRTKNNMQLINAMLNIQSQTIQDESLQKKLKDIEVRIHSMALVHQELYDSGNLTQIMLDDYIRTLLNDVISNYSELAGNISINLSLEPVPVYIDSAIPCGLVINELLINIIKHAFPCEQDEEISINLTSNGNGEIQLSIKDNGCGVEDESELRKKETFGIPTVYTLVEHQLGGSIRLEIDNGLKWTIVFEEKGFKPRL